MLRCIQNKSFDEDTNIRHERALLIIMLTVNTRVPGVPGMFNCSCHTRVPLHVKTVCVNIVDLSLIFSVFFGVHIARNFVDIQQPNN